MRKSVRKTLPEKEKKYPRTLKLTETTYDLLRSEFEKSNQPTMNDFVVELLKRSSD